LFNKPLEYIPVKGIRNKVIKIRVVGTDEVLKSKVSGGAGWVNIPGILMISPPAKTDNYVTVIAVELEEELDLYHGPGYKSHE
jgi:alpha-L-fucosidase